jgi:hypothetical protein
LNEKEGQNKLREDFKLLIKNSTLILIDWSWPNAWKFHDQQVS